MDELEESGWIKGLPSDWIGGKYAVRQLCQRLKQRFSTEELAPWDGKPDPEEYARTFGGSIQDAAHAINLNEHATAVLTHAFVNGTVAPSLFDGVKLKQLSLVAFVEAGVVRNALLFGLFDIDPLWPDEWWEWNSKPWAVPKAGFNAWLDSSRPFETDVLPVAALGPAVAPIARLEKREPSQRARVSLSEAVS